MLRIGPVQIGFPVVQAALSGYSDTAMRLIARELGCPYAIHEVILDKSLVHPGKFQRKHLALRDDDHPVGGQLMGATPEQFAEAAALMSAAGYDVIDINFGCPVRKVLGRCRGGFLLSEPATAEEIIRRVRDAVPADKPVTLKMRRGMDGSRGSEVNFFRILDAAFEYGLAAVTVHGRTVEQRYMGAADWDFLARVKRHAGERTVLGSGDLFTAADVARMLERTGVDGVTLARGCIGNPWLFRDCRAALVGEPLPAPPDVAEQGRVIRAHYELAAAVHGAKLAPRLMRKFGIRYAKMHPFPAKVREAFVRSSNHAEWLAVLDRWYDPDRDWPAGRRPSGPGELVAAGACA